MFREAYRQKSVPETSFLCISVNSELEAEGHLQTIKYLVRLHVQGGKGEEKHLQPGRKVQRQHSRGKGWTEPSKGVRTGATCPRDQGQSGMSPPTLPLSYSVEMMLPTWKGQRLAKPSPRSNR